MMKSFTVNIYSDGSIGVDNENGSTAYVTEMEVSELMNSQGRAKSAEAAIGYIAGRILAATRGFSYRGEES